jgi:1,4-alpha-glucan branching enzyme
VQDLNRVYASEPPLYDLDFDSAGFQWIDCDDNENSVVSFIRKSREGSRFVVAVLNFTPMPRNGYRIGVPAAGPYLELINSDGEAYGGANLGNGGVIFAEPVAAHGFHDSLRLTLPPLGFLLLKPGW